MTSPRAETFLRRFENLLDSTAQFLEMHLEVWTEDGRPFVSHQPAYRCLECSQSSPDLFQQCRDVRAAQCREAMSQGKTQDWICSRGLSLNALPIQIGDEVPGALLAVDAPGAGGDPKGVRPGIVVVAEADLPRFPTSNGNDNAQAARENKRKRVFLKNLSQLLSDQMGLFREVNGLRDELSTRYDELNMLYAVAGRLTSQEDLQASIRHMLDQARCTAEADVAFLISRERRMREVLLRPGLTGLDGANPRIWDRLARELHQRLSESKNRYFLGNPWDPTEGPAPFSLPLQALAVQVRVKGNPEGVLAWVHFDPERTFRSSDIRLLESLGQQVSLGMANTDLYEDLRDFLMATVKSLVGAIEAKDSYTSGHSERVNLISMLIGKAMNLTPTELETLRWASILHDVGKIGMPECILNKPSRLTPEEFEVIKEHPDRGYRLLSPIRQLAEAADSVRAHHEMMGGGGYPEGLSGAEIPRLARIIAVADTFDALTTTRPYRSARTLDYAQTEILRVRGTQLDGEVVDCFLELMPFLREHQIMIHAASEMLEEEAA